MVLSLYPFFFVSGSPIVVCCFFAQKLPLHAEKMEEFTAAQSRKEKEFYSTVFLPDFQLQVRVRYYIAVNKLGCIERVIFLLVCDFIFF